jgi:hypothetical protein
MALAWNVGGGGGGGGGAGDGAGELVDMAEGGAGEVVGVAVNRPLSQGCQTSAVPIASRVTATVAATISHRRREPLAVDATSGGSSTVAALVTPVRSPGGRGAGLVAATGGGEPCACSVSARANSPHRGKRSSGCLASAAASAGSRAARSGRVSARAGGGELR